ncbi:MAG: hypothetical protein P9X24_18295 [Candidatus Hatepunaea meridiana]|nr:hypothetical protein [Candidatus Hatepunaea meridiana]
MKNLIYHLGKLLFIIAFIVSGFAVANPLPDDIPPINAFTVGIGGAAVAVTNNPAIIYWNPAGISISNLMSVDFTLASSKVESPGTWSFLLVNSASDVGARFGMGLIRRNVVKNDEEFQSFQFIIPLSHSFKTGMFPVGMSMKFISERLDGASWKYGMAFDTGILVLLPTGFKIGLSTQNISGSNLRSFGSKSWIGVSWGGDGLPILVSGQMRTERPRSRKYNSENFNVGLNIFPLPQYPEIRGGWMRSRGKNRLTMGLSYYFKKEDARIDFTLVVDHKDWGNQAYFLTYGWGLIPTKSK